MRLSGGGGKGGKLETEAEHLGCVPYQPRALPLHNLLFSLLLKVEGLETGIGHTG